MEKVVPVFCAALLGGFVAGPSTAQGGSGTKVAIIDVEQVVKESTRGKAILAEIDKVTSDRQKALEAKSKEFDELRSRYQEMLLTLAEDKISEMEEKVEVARRSLDRDKEDAGRELQKRRMEGLSTIEREVFPVITAIGHELGYTFIFNKFQSGLLFADESTDITALVIERFNAVSVPAAAPSQ